MPNNCYVCAVGDFNAADLKARLAKAFGAWARAPITPIVVPEIPAIAAPQGIVINRPEMNQAHIYLGHVGIREGAPDVFACRLTNFILGASAFSSRIGNAVRQERGLAYDARSYFDRRLLGGAFIASTETRTESTQATLNLILKQLTDIRAKGLSDKELERARDYYLGSFPLQYESTGDRLGALDRIELCHLGLDYLDTYAANVKKVTTADVLKAAQDHIFPNHYLLVIAGNLTPRDVNLPGLVWK